MGTQAIPRRTEAGTRRIWLRFVATAVLSIVLIGANAEEPVKRDREADKRAAQRLRREWVSAQIRKLVPDERARRDILDQVRRLPDDQIQEIAVLCLDELEARKKDQLALLRAANERERAALNELTRRQPVAPPANRFAPPWMVPTPYFFGRPVGYFPVITWLPEGTSLTAQAVVSPDGRHVRMSLAPFFSTIGPVDTFNFMTGETRRYDR